MTTDSDYIETIAAIRSGDIASLQCLIADNPDSLRHDSAALRRVARLCISSRTGPATSRTVLVSRACPSKPEPT